MDAASTEGASPGRDLQEFFPWKFSVRDGGGKGFIEFPSCKLFLTGRSVLILLFVLVWLSILSIWVRRMYKKMMRLLKTARKGGNKKTVSIGWKYFRTCRPLMLREDLVMGSSNLRKKAMLEIYPEWEETGDMAAGSFSEGAWIHFLPWLAIGGVSTLLGWWKIPIISCCNCNLSTVSPGKWGSAYDLPFTMGLFFFRKRAAQFDPGAEKFPGTRRESQLSGSTHLGWLLLWQLCLSTRGRKGISDHPHRCRPNEQPAVFRDLWNSSCESGSSQHHQSGIFLLFFLSVVSQLISIRLDYFQLD